MEAGEEIEEDNNGGGGLVHHGIDDVSYRGYEGYRDENMGPI